MILEKREWIIITIVAFVLGIIIGFYSSKLSSKETLTLNETKEKIYVQIVGEIKYPGVYEMENGDRVFQLVEKAGGLSENADINSINLSKKLIDGEKITVFAKKSLTEDDSKTTQSGISSTKPKSNLININTASKEELESLPGIGPTLAQRIIDYRETNGYFQTIEDIKKVSGIGDKKFEAIKNLITVGP
ncbi:MAG: helix-hairpin-helix domain-containing protein [Caldisericia bacterium]|nr:helix-hairpin-helix domain-containing protein [Caldisericia bacterium]